MSEKKRVAIIFGGQSSEHEVSRVSAESVVKNIDRDKYDIILIGITKSGRWLTYDGPADKLGSGEWQEIAENSAQKKRLGLTGNGYVEGNEASNKQLGIRSVRNIFFSAGAEEENKKIDVVFPVLHGCNGEDGTVQGLLELAGIPYVGPGVIGSAMGMDKAYTKIIFEKEGIPQGKYLVLNRKEFLHSIEDVFAKVEAVLSYPCFVKPSNAGSSVGVSKAHNRTELKKALELAAKYDRKVLVEEFINGREIECGVLGNDDPSASVVGEIVPSNEFYDYRAKYIDNNSKAIIPADLPLVTANKIREYAVRAFKSLDCAGLSRVDFFVHKETGEIYINEINTLPGFTSISMYPQLWEASGVHYSKLISRLIELAVESFEDNRKELE